MAVLEIMAYRLQDGKNIIEQKKLKGENFDEIFRQFYELQRSTRYNNRQNYSFCNELYEAEYKDWERENETIEMYYGNSFYD